MLVALGSLLCLDNCNLSNECYARGSCSAPFYRFDTYKKEKCAQMKHTFLKTFGIKITIGGCSAMINLEIIPLKYLVRS
jgi:hypothetical protein